jgi:hypothetical protein
MFNIKGQEFDETYFLFRTKSNSIRFAIDSSGIYLPDHQIEVRKCLPTKSNDISCLRRIAYKSMTQERRGNSPT